MTNCFQHPKRKAEVTFNLYDSGDLVTLGVCHNCRHATAIAALVHEDVIGGDYEIVGIEE